MKELIVSLLIFISQNSNLHYDGNPHVSVIPVDSLTLTMIAHNGRIPKGRDYRSESIVGLFHQGSETVYLAERLDLDSVYGQSVLVHELVHYLQFQNGLYASSICIQSLEQLAYEMTNKYLVANGERALFSKRHIRAAVGFCGDY